MEIGTLTYGSCQLREVFKLLRSASFYELTHHTVLRERNVEIPLGGCRVLRPCEAQRVELLHGRLSNARPDRRAPNTALTA